MNPGSGLVTNPMNYEGFYGNRNICRARLEQFNTSLNYNILYSKIPMLTDYKWLV